VHVFDNLLILLKTGAAGTHGDTPLFPSNEGKICSKAAINCALNKAGALLRLKLKSHNLADSFGGTMNA
jgi:hypothetical protein